MKQSFEDVSVGLERLGAAIRVLGTYTTNYKCVNCSGDIVVPGQIEMTFDLLADYADLMGEQMDEILLQRSESAKEHSKIVAL